MDTKECGLWQRPERAGGNLVLASCGRWGDSNGIHEVQPGSARGRRPSAWGRPGAALHALSARICRNCGVLERVKRGPGSGRARRAEEGSARSRSPLPGAGTGGGAGSRSSPEAARPCARAPGGGRGCSRPRGSKPRRAPRSGWASTDEGECQGPAALSAAGWGSALPRGRRRRGYSPARAWPCRRTPGTREAARGTLGARRRAGRRGGLLGADGRAGRSGGPSRAHSRARRKSRKTPRRSTARGKMLGNPRGARTGALEAAAPPPSALTGAREEARAHARRRPPTWAPRPGSGGRGGGGRVAERRGRGGPRGRKAVAKRPRRRRIGEARVGRGGCRRGEGGRGWPCSRWRCGQRGGQTSVSSLGAPAWRWEADPRGLRGKRVAASRRACLWGGRRLGLGSRAGSRGPRVPALPPW